MVTTQLLGVEPALQALELGPCALAIFTTQKIAAKNMTITKALNNLNLFIEAPPIKKYRN
jgi:hypothetical protein